MTIIALTDGMVVTSLSPPKVTRADVTIEGERITGVGLGITAPEAQRIDCKGRLVMPGLVCAHHHLYSSLARGMPYSLAQPRSFLEILRRVWWRLDRALDPESISASAWVGTIDALLSGTTTIIDHHASPNAIEGSLSRVMSGVVSGGARAVLCYEISDRDGSDAVEAALKEARSFAEALERLRQEPPYRPRPGWPYVRTMVGAHASFTLSEETLKACVQTARDLVTGIHIHVAEDAVDQRDSMARFGKRVVRRLADAGVLNEQALLAHCIKLDDDELATLNASWVTAVHNPRSNMNNRVGHARVNEFERLALGTDGIGGDMFAESKAGYWRARESDPDLPPQWTLDRLGESARFAAAVFGEPLLGRIEMGAPADLIVLDYDPPTPLAADNLAEHFVFGLSAGMVRHAFVGGSLVVHDHRLVTYHRPNMRRESREAAAKLWRRMEEIPEHPFVPAGGD